MNNPLDNVVDQIIMQRVAGHVVFMIRRRTQAGAYLPGSSSGASQYSTKPFAMPAYALGKMLGKKFEALTSSKRKTQGPNSFTLYKNEKWGNQLWVIAHLGYREIRRMAGKPVDNVSMIWSGRYLRDLGIFPNATPQKAEIGWKSKENEILAMYHEELGAGKSKRKHKILGLTEEEIKSELLPFAETEIVKKLMKQGFNEVL